MNFKIARFISLGVSFIFGAFFLIAGILGIIFPWSAYIRTAIVEFLLEDYLILPLFGLGLILIGISLIIYTFYSTKRKYIQIKSSHHSVTIDENLVSHYLDTYWQDLFPNNLVPSKFRIKKNAIEIIADLPYVNEETRDSLLKQIQNDFNDIFGRILGYSQQIILIASFQPKQKSTS